MLGALHVQDAERLVPALPGRAYRRRHRLPARQLVRLISHRLVRVSEPGPRQRFADPGDRGQRGVRQVGGDRLVEPHVVPPPRPHQGAEPQVCHLMRADHRALLVASSVRPPEQLLVHHHQAGDRQRHGGQVRHEHDVVRGVGARHAEAVGVPGDRIAGIPGEPGQGSHRRLAKERLPVPDGHFRPARLGTRCGRERPGAERQVVRPHPADRSERAHITLAPGEPAVRHALPPVGDAHREPERRGQIRLVKAAEQLRPAVRVAQRQHVARAIRRISEPAQPPPLLRVPSVGLHHQDRLITPAGPAQPQPAVLGWRQGHPIERHAAHTLGAQLGERAHARPQPPEPDLGPGQHRLGRQVEKHIIRIDFDSPRPLNRLILGQIRHPASLTRSLVVARHQIMGLAASIDA